MKTTDLMTAQEIQTVVFGLRRRAARSPNTRLTLVVIRTALCNLRAKELCGLLMKDMMLTGPKPCINIRACITKGQEGKRKGREVPLWVIAPAALADIKAWYDHRITMGAGANDPFLCRVTGPKVGQPITTVMAARRWKTATACLGECRQAQLHIHAARHTWISHAVAAGWSLVAIRDWAGHTNIATTSCYLHYIEPETPPPNLYATT